MILGRNIDDTISNMLEGHLLQLVRVELLVSWRKILMRHGEGRIDTIGRVLGDPFFVTDIGPFLTIYSADSQHFLLLDCELLILTLVHR